jgi:hypothetical protein
MRLPVLTNQFKRDKSTLVSSETLGFAIELSESIKASIGAKAKKMKEDLKQTKLAFP